MEVFTAREVAFAYNGPPVLRRVSFAVRPGRLVCLLGQNGCGKTTLLRLLLGLLVPASGRLRLGDREPASLSRREMARRVAYVPQTHHPAFAHSVLDMVLMGRAAHGAFFGRPTGRDRDIAARALDRFGLGHLGAAPVTRLSGGQRQLTLLARGLAQQAPVLVLDEPVTGLDFGHQARFLEILRELCAEGHTCVMTTHSPDHALWVADQVILLQDGQVMADGAPSEVLTGDTLGRLYDDAISVLPLRGTIRVCLPDRIGRMGDGKDNTPPAAVRPGNRGAPRASSPGGAITQSKPDTREIQHGRDDL
jgi:iron complex transport system ATP-binding protein